jgi:ferredoxin
MTLHYEESAHSATAQPSGSSIRRDDVVSDTPKLAALASLANLEAPQPLATVSYSSKGNALVVAGDAHERASRAAQSLSDRLHVTLLQMGEPGASGKVTIWSGRIAQIDGYLGEFNATLADLRTEARTPAREAPARFDLVLDFSREPLFARRHPPQGYFRAPAAESALALVLDEMRDAVGEFEKPRFFAYRENVCAHQRSEITGCSACIDICSTEAIRADGDRVKVDPHLCMGCGACATVCPSGAMSYQFPRVADRGAQVKQLLATYRHAGGCDACIVFHPTDAAPELPAHALPLEAWHVASIGLDVLLPAIAFGASHVVVIASPSEDREYVTALQEQMAIGEAILQGLGYPGHHFAVLENDPASIGRQFAELAPAATVSAPATFLVSNDKRTAVEFAVEHLARHAPKPVDEIPLSEGAPFGEVRVDRQKCTMCMSCVGACPVSALMDGVDQPLLKFVERNCVQCGLCEATCPEDAITLNPRLLLTPGVREARVLNQTEPFHCVSCGKAFGTKQLVETMLGRLADHSMFSRPEALRRLQMCGDCRVVDMMSNKNEVSVLSLGDKS